jgi:amino acid adenylation domain-containing protein
MLKHPDILAYGPNGGSDQRIDALHVLTPAEERQLLLDWNATHRDYPKQTCIHHLFEAQVARTPDAIAVTFERNRLTYRELDSYANQLARRLKVVGAGPEVLVGICLERSERMVAALLAVLKAGAAYVPLDPGHPLERLKFMSQDAGIGVLVTEQDFAGLFPNFRGPVVGLDADWTQLKSERGLLVENAACSCNLAYVIYTSGSTGQPHGVQIEHRSVVNFLLSMQREPGLCSSDRLLSVTTPCFDIAALEIFLPLTVGAELFLASREVAADGQRLVRELSQRHISVMQATPATWRMLLDAQWSGAPQLKALCGGDTLSRELANELIRRTHELWNLYGPTETTIWSMTARIEDEQGPVLIGKPIANTRVYILDQHHMPVPIGVSGEMYIAGDGVARGYWNRPELTPYRFVELPFERGHVYRTGDIARYRANGGIEYLGRRDFQVKVRGFRIELAEVESALRVVNGVKEAVVKSSEHQGEKHLVAYLECEREDIPGQEQIRSRLKEILPEYMVPSKFVIMERLPLTPNGKIDLNALRESKNPDTASDGFVAPRDHFERQMAKVWEEVLGVKAIGVTQNFFELGGHSLLAARLISRIEKVTGYNLPVATLFQSPTVELLANTLRTQSWKRSWSPVVELRRGTTAPFFCVHSLGANLVSYQRLASSSGPDQQFYGLQPYGLDGEREPQASIEDMARAYIDEIRRIQPRGPYRLGGVCLGGLVSFEMAQQLKADGQEVSLLLLIDTDFPAKPEHLHIRSDRLAWLDYHLGEMLRLPVAEKAKYLLRGACNSMLRLLRNSLPAKLRDANESSLTRATQHVMEVNLWAALNYTPRRYSGRLTLFCCGEKSRRSYEDRRLAWSQVADEGVEVHLIPGNHLSMVADPHVQVMANKLRVCLERARRAEESRSSQEVPSPI